MVLLTGCGGGLHLVAVRGQITLDGKPVKGAGVTFMPQDKGPAAYGVTDQDGNYQLSTINSQGIVPGSYHVVVSLKESLSQFGDPAGVSGGPPPGSEAKVRWLVPQKYAFPATSGLEAKVGEEGGAFDFKLSSGA